jgi:hypothetical protein
MLWFIRENDLALLIWVVIVALGFLGAIYVISR